MVISTDFLELGLLQNWFIIGFTCVAVAGIAGLGVHFLVQFFRLCR